jgi:hypothetical protein
LAFKLSNAFLLFQEKSGEKTKTQTKIKTKQKTQPKPNQNRTKLMGEAFIRTFGEQPFWSSKQS